MTIFGTFLIVITIILLLLTQDVALRVQHRIAYAIDIDTAFIGISIYTDKSSMRSSSEVVRTKDLKKKKQRSAIPYYYTIEYLLSHSKVAVGKLSIKKSAVDTVIVALPSYIITYSILSLILNKSMSSSISSDYNIFRPEEPNIDVTFRFSLVYLIISLCIFQYYNLKCKPGR